MKIATIRKQHYNFSISQEVCWRGQHFSSMKANIESFLIDFPNSNQQRVMRQVTQVKPTISTQQLRRLALSRQGLIGRNGFGRLTPGTLKAIEHLGYIQIDTISVVERAHHHVLWSRVPGYQLNDLDKLLKKKHIFEYWAHAAAFLPMRDYRFTLPRKNAIKQGEVHWYRNLDKKLLKRTLDRIRIEGPLRARDFEHTRKTNSQGWWDWKPAKRALEQLFMQGDLMAVERAGFQKVYDLTERVLPDHVDTREPDMEEYASFLVNSYIRAHGFGTLKAISYLRRSSELRKAIARVVEQGIEAGEFIDLGTLSGSHSKIERFFIHAPLASANRITRPRTVLKLLSPFDNLLIQRDRTLNVHAFDYQIECYVPAAKRKYGYFSLPLLYGDVLAGRVDCKAHRKIRQLEVINLVVGQALDMEEALPVFQTGLRVFADFNKCETITVSKVSPASWKKPVTRLFN